MWTPAKSLSYLLMAAVIFGAGSLANRQQDFVVTSASAVERHVTFTRPIHPQHRLDRASTYPTDMMRVEPKWPIGDRLQISLGLEPGKRSVVSGNSFNLSESRIGIADSGSTVSSAKAEMAKDLVCGMDVDPKSPNTLKTQYKGSTYYFCSEHCKKSFEANPESYLPKKTSAAQAEKAKDLVCGMDVDPKSPNTLKTQYKGKTYYFCSEMCKKSFAENPEQYIRKMADPEKHGMHMTE